MAGAATKRCNGCGLDKPATTEFFFGKPSGKNGLASKCKACAADAQRRRRAADPEHVRAIVRASQRRRSATAAGRAEGLLRNYRSIDSRKDRVCDLDAAWLAEHIVVPPCVYCGDEGEPRGADRVDNSIGHTKANVVPACMSCNLARGNRYTPEEMRLFIGPAIAAAKAARRAVKQAM